MAEAEQTSSPRLRPAQVFGTTLAAVSGAFFASKLGVHGTIIGVGVISLMSTVGGELYLRSLDRTKVAAKTATVVAKARKSGPATSAMVSPATLSAITTDVPADAVTTELLARAADTPELGAAVTDEFAGGAVTDEFLAVADTQELGPGVDTLAPSGSAGDIEAESIATEVIDAVLANGGGASAGERSGSGRGLRWPLIAAGTVAGFALAMLVITGIETFTGSSLSGTNGSTVSQLFSDRSGQSTSDGQPNGPAPAPTSTPSPDDEAGGGSGQPTTPPAEPSDSPVNETEPPDETEPPEETESPDETESPEETESPDETEPPEETESPDETERRDGRDGDV